ncbi:MAG: EAL domain-containing protein [Eubacteriales bacterium]|nr:EAL domain-containing protein [Eubacteriales bacterium]
MKVDLEINDGGNRMADRKGSFELADQIEKLKDAAYRDYVTGLLNRGAAEIYIENILGQLRDGENCMLIIVDLDNFKMVNDTLGHQTGDKVICTAANILSGLFRPGDVVARLGGDEYIVFLYGNVTKRLARQKGSDICQHLQLTVGDTKQVTISSSVGIYFSTDSDTTFQAMYRMADRALYQAKQRGKNQYYICESDRIGLGGSEKGESHDSLVIKATGGAHYSYNSVVYIDGAETARVLHADGAFCRMLGMEEHEIVGEMLTEHMHPEDLPEFRSAAGDLAANKDLSVQIRLKSSLGDWVYNKLNASAAEYEGTRCILLNLSNVLEAPRKSFGRRRGRGFLVGGGDQTGWEVDLVTKEFQFYDDSHVFMEIPPGVLKFPHDAISSGWISPESADRFMKFAAGIFTGRLQGYCNALVRSGDGMEYVWGTFSYHVQGGMSGASYKVMGIVTPLNEDVQDEKTPFARRNAVPVPVIDGLVVKLDANVSKDYVTKIWVEGSFQEREYQNKKIAYFIVNEGSKICDKGDKVRFAGFFSRGNLKELYRRGEYWLFVEYRRVDSAGYIEWVTLAMNLYKKTLDEDILVRLRINKCDDRHNWECLSSQKEIRNQRTNLYTPSVLREILKGMRADASRELCGAVLVRLDGLERIFGEDGEKAASSRVYIINMLSYTLGTRCMAAKADDEHYLFFFPDVHSSTDLSRLLEMAINYSRLLLSDVMPIHDVYFLAAVVCLPLKNASYNGLCSICRVISDNYRDLHEDKIVFHHDKGEGREKSAFSRGDFEKEIAVLSPLEDMLTLKEQQLFSDCLSDMLLGVTPEKGLMTLFQRLGENYQADRIYVLSLENTNKDIEVFSEWKRPYLETISILISRTSIDKLQLLTRCSIEKKPLCYSARAKGGADGGEETWTYCIFPLRFSERAYTVTDFLCLENPRRAEDGYALLHKLLPYIKNQKLRVKVHGENVSLNNRSRLEGLPNLMEYIEAIPSFLSPKYTSMAVFLVKIPRLSILNSHHGFEYGQGMLRYTADTLAETLGDRALYRTWDNEFIAVLPNVEKSYVEERFKSLRTAFNRRYGEHVVVNFRWTEDTFTRRVLMEMPKAGTRRRILDMDKYLKSQVEDSEDAPVEDCGFTVYIQPVFDMNATTVVGAELLVRGLGKNGEVILPRRFLKRMEHGHTIRNLDLFVLDKAFVIMEDWRERRFQEIPLSVNFSRETILDPTIVASFLATRSRYPQLDQRKIQIELPQNIGEEHYDRLAVIMEQMREFGAEFAVDDMGVDKENTKILSRIRFDTVKIDHSLMVDLGTSEGAREMTRAISNTCMDNRISCVAEGVETKEQLDAARMLGCGYVQGFYYDKPMTVEAFNGKYMNNPMLLSPILRPKKEEKPE